MSSRYFRDLSHTEINNFCQDVDDYLVALAAKYNVDTLSVPTHFDVYDAVANAIFSEHKKAYQVYAKCLEKSND